MPARRRSRDGDADSRRPRRRGRTSSRFRASSLEVLADQRELLQDVVGHGDDVAADRVGLEDVQQLARARPDQLGLRLRAAGAPRASAMSGTGSRPVSAMRPANTETIAGVSGARRVDDRATCSSVMIAVTFSLHAGRATAARISGPQNSPLGVGHRNLHVDVLAPGRDLAGLPLHLVESSEKTSNEIGRSGIAASTSRAKAS